ncbi:similar to RIKEN cDNA 2410022L05 (predicted), isoform CRA_b [Rattus norvegicus]|uniref:Coordinator of PRMT5 and differentiation stimulator n=2 Tax=Rattus norvegicus TaxID=10116 RepID=D3ZB92_RAT|nr:similar to RIKEN cDNA 2410022L05 (predicted), isoform CRA_b [Rattus norvegicus]
MDPQAATGPGPGEPSAWEAPSAEAGLATADLSGGETETELDVDRLGNGAQSIPTDVPTHAEGPSSEEEGFAMEKEADGELYAWELSEGPACPPMEQASGLFNEDWDLELKADQGNPYDADDVQGSISQEIKPWVCCAPQGDMMYDPSWHHPPPLIPHYSKMVFETGQFDDAED